MHKDIPARFTDSPSHSLRIRCCCKLILHRITPGRRGVAEPHFLHHTPIHALSVQYLGGVYTAAPRSWRVKEHVEIKDGMVVFPVMQLGAKTHSFS